MAGRVRFCQPFRSIAEIGDAFTLISSDGSAVDRESTRVLNTRKSWGRGKLPDKYQNVVLAEPERFILQHRQQWFLDVNVRQPRPLLSQRATQPELSNRSLSKHTAA